MSKMQEGRGNPGAPTVWPFLHKQTHGIPWVPVENHWTEKSSSQLMNSLGL